MTPPTYLNRPEPELVIGVDESGTGAFAGPFTVCAYMARVEHEPWIKEVGAKDSKRLAPKRRMYLRDELAACASIVGLEVVPNDYVEQRRAWREAVAKAVGHCLKTLYGNTLRVAIKIDGSPDTILDGYFRRTWDLTPEFIVGGDDIIPQISAASIFAKCQRSELMTELHQKYPMYGWAANDGYGTAEHMAAIEKHGICELHRRVRPLLPYFSGI